MLLGAEIVLLLLAGVAMAFVLPFLSPVNQLGAAALGATAVAVVNVLIFHYGNLVLPLASGLTLIAALIVFSMAYGFFVEARGKRQMTGLFGHYVPPELVDEMAKNSPRFSMQPESRE